MYNIHTWKAGEPYTRIEKRNIKSEMVAEAEAVKLAESGQYVRVEIRDHNTKTFLQSWINCHNPNIQGILV